MSAQRRFLEVLPGLAGQAGRAEGFEELVGHTGHLGSFEQLAQQGAATALRGADEIGDPFRAQDSSPGITISTFSTILVENRGV